MAAVGMAGQRGRVGVNEVSEGRRGRRETTLIMYQLHVPSGTCRGCVLRKGSVMPVVGLSVSLRAALLAGVVSTQQSLYMPMLMITRDACNVWSGNRLDGEGHGLWKSRFAPCSGVANVYLGPGNQYSPMATPPHTTPCTNRNPAGS